MRWPRSQKECWSLKSALRCKAFFWHILQRWSPWGRPWGRPWGVLEDVLEDTFWSPWPWPWPRRSSPWPWPRSFKSSKIALSSARGQQYFLNSWISLENARNFAENLRAPFGFSHLEHRRGQGEGNRGSVPSPIEISPMTKCDKKAYSFFGFSFFFTFFACNSITNNNIEDQGLRVPLKSIFASQFKRITRRKRGVFVLKVAISGPHLAFLWT